MLSTKTAKQVIAILALLILAAISFFFMGEWISSSDYVQYSMEQVEKNSETVMAFEAAALSASLAISAMPEDFASPYAAAFTDMNIFFVLILIMLLIEKLLLIFGFKFAFSVAVPIACILVVITILTKKDGFKIFAARLCILGLAVALAVPGSTYITDVVATDLNNYVEQTIAETNDGAEKINLAADGEGDGATVFERLSGLFSTAIEGIKDLMQYFQNMITKCMYAIAIMLLKTMVMPIVTFLFLRWVINETVHIIVPVPQIKTIREKLRGNDDYDDDDDNDDSVLAEAKELLGIGE